VSNLILKYSSLMHVQDDRGDEEREVQKQRSSWSRPRVLIPMALLGIICAVPCCGAALIASLGQVIHATATTRDEATFMLLGEGQFAWKFSHKTLLTKCVATPSGLPNVRVAEVEYFTFVSLMPEDTPYPMIRFSTTQFDPYFYDTIGCPPWPIGVVEQVGVSAEEAEKYGD
jgi:hypothetical protein